MAPRQQRHPAGSGRDPGRVENRPAARQRVFRAERLAPAESRGAGAAPRPLRRELLKEFRGRLEAQAAAPAAPQPPESGWVPLGPSVVRQGESLIISPVSGRVTGLAVAPGGRRAYAATANGGVWLTEDAGAHWRVLTDTLSAHPPRFGADSLACGAIAIAPDNPELVYVGTGEGAEGPYFGVGPLVSRNGGQDWQTEPSTPDLGGSAFYALAVDPGDSNHVVAATHQGLYQRQPAPEGNGYRWVQTLAWTVPPPVDGESDDQRASRERAPRATSVVAARRGTTTTFFAAHWGEGVFSSTDGKAWRLLGPSPPAAGALPAGVACMVLGVQPDNPDVVYALASNVHQHLHGLYRYDRGDNVWRLVADVPEDLFGADPNKVGQGWYDLAVAVAPDNIDQVYVGGAGVTLCDRWAAALYRLDVTASRVGGQITGFSAASAAIGATAHADVHALVFAPGDAKKLWVGCDGGVFASESATRGWNVFTPRNTGLATLMMLSLAQHPTEDAILFGGTQDNGCLRYSGEEAWLYSSPGDGGGVLVNWHDPYKVLSTYTEASYRVSTTGGQPGSYQYFSVPLEDVDRVDFYPPIAGPPFNPGNPTEADLVAFGSNRVWLNTQFGAGEWEALPVQPPGAGPAATTFDGLVKALTFASGDKLYAATEFGAVYRFRRTPAGWQAPERLDTLGGEQSLKLGGVVTSLAVDPADPSGESLYLTHGGEGDYRRVWHFDGARWEARSGPGEGAPTSLLNVHFNVILADPDDPKRLYAAADLGVWRSLNAGKEWEPFARGLPEAAVVDMQLFRSRDPARPLRLLRAATHGRGVFECDLDGPRRSVSLYSRHTVLDAGRFPSIEGLDDPTNPGQRVDPALSPDVKIDYSADGSPFQFPEGNLDFLRFVDQLQDWAESVPYGPNRRLRAYVQVHNRGELPANDVRVMLLLSGIDLKQLPDAFPAKVQAGTAIQADAGWKTVGVSVLQDVRAGAPQIAAFDLPPDQPPAAAATSYYFLAVVHHADDPFTTDVRDGWVLGRAERKAALKFFTMQGTGT